MKTLAATLLLGLASCTRTPAMPAAPPDIPTKPLASFSAPSDLAAFKGLSAHLSLTKSAAAQNGQAMQIEFQPDAWPKAETRANGAWDWSGYDGIAFDVSNSSPRTVDFGVRVDDDPAANGATHCKGGTASIAPHTSQTYVLPLTINPAKYGMRGAPTVGGMEGMDVLTGYDLNLSHIVAYQIYMHLPRIPTTLLIDNVRLVKAGFTIEGIVDEFGQYSRTEWPGKAHSASDITHEAELETRDLAAHPDPRDRDNFGAWANGPTLNATGFFHTAKQGSKWTLVAPNGHLFLSLGMNGVGNTDYTIVNGREQMFEHPPTNGAANAHLKEIQDTRPTSVTHKTELYDFAQANLETKYGPDYAQKWRKVSEDRLKSWGFNTVAEFSSPTYFTKADIPYVVGLSIGGNHARVTSFADTWGKMHDPFDPQFAADFQKRLSIVPPQIKNDPFCIGYFVDNELSWGGEGNGRYGLAVGALFADENAPAKQAFLAQLKAKYGDVGRFNTAWGTSYADWNGLNPSVKLKVPYTSAAQEDMGAFVLTFARKYFQTVRDVLKAADPNHLYLGCRFARYTPESLKAASEFADVISFNVYQPTIDPQRWAVLSDLNKPAIVGEFHFGALDRGMFHSGLVSAANQEARATRYREYVESLLDSPYFVGCHWFQYVDQPLTGRFPDGENYGIGFVSVTDRPYPELVATARAVNDGAYTRRFGKQSAQR